MRYSCYIEEYRNEQNQICARLRDKASNKKILVTGKNVDKNHMLHFLSQAKIRQEIMPSIYEREGVDAVVVDGMPVEERENEIVVNVESGGYMFD